jgi:hypothetical protein
MEIDLPEEIGRPVMPMGVMRPISPPYIAELAPSPPQSPCVSPTLALIQSADAGPVLPPAGTARARALTKAVCKRASRMARPSEPTREAKDNAAERVAQIEAQLRLAGMERVVFDDLQRFRQTAASTGKGPAVRANEEDETVQAVTNHMVSLPCNAPSETRLTCCCTRAGGDQK